MRQTGVSRRRLLTACGAAVAASVGGRLVAGTSMTEPDRAGARLAAGAAGNRTNATRTPAATESSSDSVTEARRVLRGPSFVPTNADRFLPDLYGGREALAPEAEPADVDRIEAELRSMLERRFPDDPAAVSEGLAQFRPDGGESESLVRTIPEPRLRAAAVGLRGTLGESSLRSILDGTFRDVSFGTVSKDSYKAEVRFDADGDARIVFDREHRYDDWRRFVATMAHEPFHHDTEVNDLEELICNAFESLVYAQVVSEFPAVARGFTALTQSENSDLLARLNSRDESGNLTLTGGNGPLYPDSDEPGDGYADEWAGWKSLPATPGNEVLAGALRNATGREVDAPEFDAETVGRLDSGQAWLDAEALVGAAKTLDLETGDDPVGTA